MSTLQEIKAAAATLTVADQNELITWLSESEELAKMRYNQLKAEIQAGLDELDRGEGEPLDMEAIKREARERFDARQRS